MEERRSLPRLNLGKLNYEAVMKVLHGETPFPAWEQLTLKQHAAYDAAAAAVFFEVSKS